MDTDITEIVFEPEDDSDIIEINIFAFDEETNALMTQLFRGKFFDGSTLYVHKFLRPDLSINLEKLELATILAVKWLELYTLFDDPITLYLDGIEKYYELRGISDKPKNKKEEYYVIRGIVGAVANNESYKPVRVEYVADKSSINPRGQ